MTLYHISMYRNQDFPASHTQKPNNPLRATGLAPEVSTIQRQLHRAGFEILRSNGDGCDLRNLLMYRIFIAILDQKIQPNVGIYTPDMDPTSCD